MPASHGIGGSRSPLALLAAVLCVRPGAVAQGAAAVLTLAPARSRRGPLAGGGGAGGDGRRGGATAAAAAGSC